MQWGRYVISKVLIFSSIVTVFVLTGFKIFVPVLFAQEKPAPQPRSPVSYCQAVAEGSGAIFHRATIRDIAVDDGEVSITFVGHSSFRIETAAGVVIVTDYAGYSGRGRVPDIVTMNRAHESHYTDFIDPEIRFVLRGWNDKEGFAFHDVRYRDVRIRNVPTNIRDWSGGTLLYGNSIFVFEIAQLCIGHVGHLHHTLTPQQLAQIGQLDVVFVPADGLYTMDHAGMAEAVRQLNARLTIPMHYFAPSTLKPFLERMRSTHKVDIRATPNIVVSRKTLPEEPQVTVLPGF
jgi:L-ascorbate metabolism protein UlaG (beta-lactamase superfamily)